MKTVIFVRHGKSPINETHTLSDDPNDNPLTDLGRRMVKDIAKEIARLPKIDNFYTSPFLRARETSEIIARKINMEPKVDFRLREQDYGRLNGERFGSLEHMNAILATELRGDRRSGLESWEEIKNRIGGFMQELPAGISVAVTHRPPICAAIALINNNFEPQFLAPFALRHVPIASMTVVYLDGSRVTKIGCHHIPRALNPKSDGPGSFSRIANLILGSSRGARQDSSFDGFAQN